MSDQEYFINDDYYMDDMVMPPMVCNNFDIQSETDGNVNAMAKMFGQFARAAQKFADNEKKQIDNHNGFDVVTMTKNNSKPRHFFVVKSQLLADFALHVVPVAKNLYSRKNSELDSSILFQYFNELDCFGDYMDLNKNNISSSDLALLKEQYDDLHTTLSKLHDNDLETIKNMTKNGRISYEYLHNYYVIGKKYTYKYFDTICVGTLKNKMYHNFPDKLLLTFERIKYNHKEKFFEKVTSNGEVYSFLGTTEISELPHVIPDEETLKMCSERGKKYIELVKDVKYVQYTGFKFEFSPFTGLFEKINATGRVIIDDADPHCQIGGRMAHIRQNQSKVSGMKSISEQDYYLCDSILTGYSLNHHYGWGYFDISNISDIKFDSGAFDSLCLGSDNDGTIKSILKDIVLAKKNVKYQDIISGKSSGLIFLLHGPPGTGKTCTGEAISEILQYPLYRLGFGDLGIMSDQIEKSLKNAFELANRWNAIILIDEADTVLEKRSDKANFSINSITNVFLRHIEMYEGILFLTTNRLNSIDPAFDSRITIKLNYKFTDSIKESVWKNY